MRKTREEIILRMCHTYRSDYGSTELARQFIHNKMSQIFDNDIAPNMEFKRARGPAHSCDIEGCAVCDPTFGL